MDIANSESFDLLFKNPNTHDRGIRKYRKHHGYKGSICIFLFSWMSIGRMNIVNGNEKLQFGIIFELGCHGRDETKPPSNQFSSDNSNIKQNSIKTRVSFYYYCIMNIKLDFLTFFCNIFLTIVCSNRKTDIFLNKIKKSCKKIFTIEKI